MEFLFTDRWASTEALLVFICLAIFLGMYAYDAYLYLRARFARDSGIGGTIVEITEPQTLYYEWIAVTNPILDTVIESAASPEAPVETIETPIEVVESGESGAPETIEVVMDPIVKADIPVEWEAIGDVPAISDRVGTEAEISEIWESQDPSEIVGESSETIDTIPTDDVEGSTLSESTPENWEETPITEDTAEIIEKPLPYLPVDNIESNSPTPSPSSTSQNTETLFALINTIRTHIARGNIQEARGLIIQGLSLDKWNRDLNLMLGGIYEWDHHFEKAEYIYKDLALEHSDDIEVLEKLGNVLIIEKRYEIAIEIYRKILRLGWDTESALYITAHLASELRLDEEKYDLAKRYLRQWPNNPEILLLLGQSEIALVKRRDAIETLKRLKNLTPYNSEITEMIAKLVMEEELAGNFGEGK
jgi:tetratricopeptide (TPR) repeat protein